MYAVGPMRRNGRCSGAPIMWIAARVEGVFGCDAVPVPRLQWQCMRACDGSVGMVQAQHYDCLRFAVGVATYVANTNTQALRSVRTGCALTNIAIAWLRNVINNRRATLDRAGAVARAIGRPEHQLRSPGGRPHSRVVSRFSSLRSPGHDSDRPIHPHVARNAGSRYTAARRHNGPPRPRLRCSRQQPG